MTVRRGTSAGRHVHVDQARTASGVLSREKDGLGVSDDSIVSDFRIVVRLNTDEFAAWVVRWDRYNRLLG